MQIKVFDKRFVVCCLFLFVSFSLITDLLCLLLQKGNYNNNNNNKNRSIDRMSSFFVVVVEVEFIHRYIYIRYISILIKIYARSDIYMSRSVADEIR